MNCSDLSQKGVISKKELEEHKKELANRKLMLVEKHSQKLVIEYLQLSFSNDPKEKEMQNTKKNGNIL